MKSQLFPILIALLTAFGLILLFTGVITILNLLPLENISLQLLPLDILVGMTIYLKTSIDFALFTGSLMSRFGGVKNRIAIEIGTALGNGFGTILILIVWTFFKEVPLLLFFMILLASFVLLDLARESTYAYIVHTVSPPKFLKIFALFLFHILSSIHDRLSFLFRFITPHPPTLISSKKGFVTLFFFALTIPFILGLDDFAGYIPLFSLIHIFGFCIGVILGHLLLTISLFAFPNTTVRIVRYPLVQLLGSTVFVALAIFGFIEAFHTVLPLFMVWQK